MGFKSPSGLRHIGNVCESIDSTTYEEVYDSDVIPGATFRRCRVCLVCRTTFEDDYGRPVTGAPTTDPHALVPESDDLRSTDRPGPKPQDGGNRG